MEGLLLFILKVKKENLLHYEFSLGFKTLVNEMAYLFIK